MRPSLPIAVHKSLIAPPHTSFGSTSSRTRHLSSWATADSRAVLWRNASPPRQSASPYLLFSTACPRTMLPRSPYSNPFPPLGDSTGENDCDPPAHALHSSTSRCPQIRKPESVQHTPQATSLSGDSLCVPSYLEEQPTFTLNLSHSPVFHPVSPPARLDRESLFEHPSLAEQQGHNTQSGDPVRHSSGRAL
jgi:hypothetical protein